MISDETGRQLHDRATRGGMLHSDERALLNEWLTEQDEAETQLLSPKCTEPALAALRAQVDLALEQVGIVTRNIQQRAMENDVLRREIAALQNRLATRPASQAA